TGWKVFMSCCRRRGRSTSGNVPRKTAAPRRGKPEKRSDWRISWRFRERTRKSFFQEASVHRMMRTENKGDRPPRSRGESLVVWKWVVGKGHPLGLIL